MTPTSTGTRPQTTNLPATIALWVLRVLLAGVFLFSGVPKLLGDEQAKATFEELGAGQWLRYFIGVAEIAGGIGLLVPIFAGLAALGLMAVMAGAALSEAFVLDDGDPVVPAIIFLLAGVVAWFLRSSTVTAIDYAQERVRPKTNG
jgi:putative oxidoreductase